MDKNIVENNKVENSSMEKKKTYDPSIESKWYQYWLDNKLFSAKGRGRKFSIVAPPPNVTGILHIGHCLNNTIQDLIIRYKRLKGFDALWVPGLDHAGISVQQKIKQKIEAEGKTLEEIGKDNFLKEAWAWKEAYGDKILNQFKLLGLSLDWGRTTFTLDENYKAAVKEIFMKLYNDDLIYRDQYIINFSTEYKTAISDDEVEFRDVERDIWYIEYDLVAGGNITVATTRPETMLGDSAIAVNPNDERYSHLIGNEAIVPVVNRRIPIIGDEYVKKDFGTGALKVTPAHDPNDFEIGKRHNLEIINIFDKDLKLNVVYEGMTCLEARKQILVDISDRVVKSEKVKSPVGHCSKSGKPIESIVSMQWFVRMQPLAKRALEVVKSGEIELSPKHWEKTYYHWLENIKDWCISRQLWWGHEIPVGGEDVLDTWFSSWLWPFAVFGWPNSSEDLDRYFPTDTLVTGADIIFFWVSRMIMASLYVFDKVPFTKVIFNGIVRDEKGRKMSKSLGNSPDPIEVIEKYSADSLRFALIYNHSLGFDVNYSESWVVLGSKFANKIWNIFRFISSLEDSSSDKLDNIDRWILSELSNLTKRVEESIESNNFDIALKSIYNFIWNEFADWYVELSKIEGGKKSLLSYILNESLKLLHPFMPFITEEIWHLLGIDKGISISCCSYPEIENYNVNIIGLKELTRMIRSIRKDLQLSGRISCEVRVLASDIDLELVSKLVNADIKVVESFSSKSAIFKSTPNVEVLVYVEKLSIDTERNRIEAKLAKDREEYKKVKEILSNEKFLSKASEKVINKKKEIEEEYRQSIESLGKQLESLRD